MDGQFKAISDWLRMTVPVIEASTLHNSAISLIVVCTICVILLGWAMQKFKLRSVKIGFISVEAAPVSVLEKTSKRKDPKSGENG
ncbi:hypothetical protein FY134_03025 [Agrobacterium fabrum]|uniref:hypothetical protein n=1 Tax=Agrobacterium fabrum TaxID=1176649 RepID=UPI0021D3C9A4|nr:hypothetical protein [Agrobacterium fabrum]UXT56671.1 hypothetical protein FY134_03025 [Agrobacterium fabrum]